MPSAATAGQVLIVENEPLIAMDLEYALDQAGYTTELRTTLRDAIDWLSSHTPAAAVLDIGLKDSSSEALAEVLNSESVPFVVYSAADKSEVSEAFSDATWIPKPSGGAEVAKAIDDCLLAGFQNEMEERG